MTEVAHVALIVAVVAIGASLAAPVVYFLAFAVVALVTTRRRGSVASPEEELAAMIEADLDRALAEILRDETHSPSR